MNDYSTTDSALEAFKWEICESEVLRDPMLAGSARSILSRIASFPLQMPMSPVSRRKYLPTFADLVDRLAIVQLKALYIHENRDEYLKERELIEHDIGLLLEGRKLSARALHAIMIIMLTNHAIWVNETKARDGGSEQNELLRFTHSINGQRNSAKNILSHEFGERKDLKIDCFASELIEVFGHWQIFPPNGEAK